MRFSTWTCLACSVSLAAVLSIQAGAQTQAPALQSVWNVPSSPRYVAVDATGNVYVTSYRTPAIRKFSSSGVLLTQWGTTGTGPGQFTYPMGIAIDGSGRVLVADDGERNRIQVFTNTGGFLGEFATGYELLSPNAVDVDPLGNIYVADAQCRCIKKFSSSGALLGQIGQPGTGAGGFNYLEAVAIDTHGEVYASDFHRVQVHTSSGNFLRQWGSPGSGPGQFNQIFGLEVDSRGIVYVADRYNGRIQMFLADGTYLAQFGSFGAGPGQFEFPWGVAADESGTGQIYVADPYLDRITVFGPPPTPTLSTSWGRLKAIYHR